MATKKKVKDSQTKVTEKSLVSGLNLERLRKLNIWLTVAFFLQAIAVVVIGGSKSAPISSQYLALDQLSSQSTGHQVLAVATRHLFDMHFTVAAAIFLVVFGFTTLAMATFCRNRYEEQLQRNSNSPRWLAFAFAGAFIVAALGLEGGISDLGGILAIFALTLVGIGLLPAVEKMRKEGVSVVVSKSVLVAALGLIAIPWLIFILDILSALMWNGHIPGNVYFMFLVTFLLFGCWLLAMRFHARQRGKWSDVIYSEKMYMLLSFLIGSILAWQMFAGAS